MLSELISIGVTTWIVMSILLVLILIGMAFLYDWGLALVLAIIAVIISLAFAQPAYDALFVVSPQEKLEREVEQAKKNAELAILQAQVDATIEALNNPPQTTPEPTPVQPTTPSNVEPQGNGDSGEEIDNGGSTDGVTTTHVGLNKWEGYQIPLPISLGPDELGYAHGDVKGNGGCSLKTFTGTIPTLSNGTFQVYIVSGGTAEARENAVPSVESVC